MRFCFRSHFLSKWILQGPRQLLFNRKVRRLEIEAIKKTQVARIVSFLLNHYYETPNDWQVSCKCSKKFRRTINRNATKNHHHTLQHHFASQHFFFILKDSNMVMPKSNEFDKYINANCSNSFSMHAICDSTFSMMCK